MGNIFSHVCDPQLVLPFLCGKGEDLHNLEDNLEALQKEMQELKTMINDLLRKISKEEGRVVPEVSMWISMVEETEAEASRLLDGSISVIQRLSMYGYCSRFSASTCRYSKSVVLTLEKVRKLRSEGGFERATLPHVKKALPHQPIASRGKLLESTWDLLMDENVGTLGIYGMGGVGKTTLLAQISNKFSDDASVLKVLFVNVGSKELGDIQNDIGRRLGLRWGRETKEVEKADEILAVLKGKRFVLLLDDIQREVNLKEIGVPMPSRDNGCKIVFTSRRREDSNRADAEVEVRLLSSEEAWGLLQKTVGETTLRSHPDIPKLARIVAEKCGGLPLALKVIGRSMASRRTVQEWRHAIHVLVSSIHDSPRMVVNILPILNFSYDALPGERIRSCFLYCALFPGDGYIRRQDLVDYWVGEGMVSDEIKGYEVISDLVGACFLMEDESGYGVKMHDMVRAMAFWITSDYWWQKELVVVKGGGRIKEMPEVNDWRVVRRMSVSSTQIEKISGSPDCVELRTLFLQGNDKLRWISGDFFRRMTNLVVLNMSRNSKLSQLPEELSGLVSLQLLNLSWTSITHLPVGLKNLIRLVHLDLDETPLLREIDVLGYLLNLQVLRLFRSVPMDLSLMEDIQLLKSLKDLSLTVREVDVLKRLLSNHRLASCIGRLDLKGITITDGGILLLNPMLSLRELDIRMCDIPEITINWRSTIQRETVHFGNIRTVTLSRCTGVRDLTWLLLAPNLGNLTLHECPQIEQIINKEKATADVSEQPFQHLTRLSLDSLPKLESIYWTPLPFPVLEYLYIRGCPKMRRQPFNSKFDQEWMWMEGVEWEKQHVSHIDDSSVTRDFPKKITEDQKMDPLAFASESHPVENIVTVGTSESGKSTPAKSKADYDDRNFPTMAENQKMDGLASESHPIENIVPVETSKSKKCTTTTVEDTPDAMIIVTPGSVGGALMSEALELVIAEAKKYKSFKPLSQELVSTMKRLLPVIKQMDSMPDELDDLKKLRDTIERARVLVHKFPGVRPYEKFKYTRKIEGINKDMDKFCNIDLQLLQYRNQVRLLGLTENLVHKVDGLSKRMDGLMSVPLPVFTDLCSVPKLDKVLVGLDWPLVELKKRLLDNAVVNLVVSAPPGCGKTTLVTQICDEADVKGKFKHIFFNVVSRTPNFRVIVQNLLQHNGYAPCIFDNDSQATVGLRKLLEKLREEGPILLVLDDVWRGAESLLQKFQITLPDYKILVTSRSDFPSFGFNYYLKPLEGEDARALLIQWASRPYNASSAEYEYLLQKILKRCDGFPILIEVVGASLKGRSLNTWKGKVESWSQEEKILGNSTMLECLQHSFNALESNLKECFLDMGSFIEDQKIRASVIIDIWVELYVKSSSILCMKYLEDLASQNLLKLVPLGNEHEDGFYNEFLVTQHDILRELAIHQSELKEKLERKRLNLEIREDNFPDWCLDPRRPIIHASLLSISTDDLFSSNWVEMDCPNVEVLVLNISSSNYALPSFIAGMSKLKVLIITNHGSYLARLSNFSCLSLLPNLKRIRLEKVSVTLLDILQLQLVSLKKLSLVMCSFGEVLYNTEEIDVSKALPSLQEIDIDYCYDLDELPYWISEAVSLKTLSITNCKKLVVLPEAIGNLSKLEVLRLSSCINLSELPETIERLSNLQFLDISHCSGLRKLPLEIGKLQKLKKISMRKCWRCELPDSVINLENLEVKCDEETGMILWERLKPKMRNLTIQEEGQSTT